MTDDSQRILSLLDTRAASHARGTLDWGSDLIDGFNLGAKVNFFSIGEFSVSIPSDIISPYGYASYEYSRPEITGDWWAASTPTVDQLLRNPLGVTPFYDGSLDVTTELLADWVAEHPAGDDATAIIDLRTYLCNTVPYDGAVIYSTEAEATDNAVSGPDSSYGGWDYTVTGDESTTLHIVRPSAFGILPVRLKHSTFTDVITVMSVGNKLQFDTWGTLDDIALFELRRTGLLTWDAIGIMGNTSTGELTLTTSSLA